MLICGKIFRTKTLSFILVFAFVIVVTLIPTIAVNIIKS